MLEQYTVKGDAATIAKALGGVELAGVQQTRSGIKADAVLTASQRAKLAATGVQVELTRNKKGADGHRAGGAPGGRWLQRLSVLGRAGRNPRRALPVARRNPQLVKLEVLGRTHQGRELIAMKLTQGARQHSATDRARRSSTRPTSMRASGSASR